MEQLSGLKQAEGKLSIIGDRIAGYQAKIEDILFRAQKIANSAKNGFKSTDNMFGYDLQSLRGDMRNFGHEISALPNLVGSLERAASYDEKCLRFAQSVMRIADRVSKGLRMLHTNASLAHQHIKDADHRIMAWFIVQEIEEMASKAQVLPTIANKVVIKVSTPDGAAKAASLPSPEIKP